MSVCVPIGDMENTAKSAASVEAAPAPDTATKSTCDAAKDQVARKRLLDRIERADAEFAAGDYAVGPSLTAQVRMCYGA